MRKYVLVAISIALFSTAFAEGSTHAAQIQTGGSCNKLNMTSTYSGNKFQCVKSGKKMLWKLIGPVSTKATPSPSPSSSSTPTPTPSPSPSSSPSPIKTENTSLTACKLQVLDGRGDVAIGGFPRISDRLKSLGKVITKVIFVDFSDQRAVMSPEDAFAKVKQSADLFTELSYSRMQFTFEPTFKWYHMSGTAKSYAPLNQSFAHQRGYMAEAISMADPEVDFSKADAILILANPDARDTGTSGPAFTPIFGSGFFLDGNYISNGATSAYDLNNWKYIWLNHEFGHTLGLVDLYAFKPEDSTNPYDYHRFVGEFSLMGLSSLDSNSPGYLAWERWLLGWVDDSQIYCMNEQSTSQLINPVERSGGLKAVIVPISTSKVVVVESRRAEGVDKNLKKSGALVYVVDSSIQSGYGPVKVFPADRSDPRRLQSPRAEGESVTVEGVTITVKKSSSDGDLVEVKRA